MRDEAKKVTRARPSRVVCQDEEFGLYPDLGRRLRVWRQTTTRVTEGFKRRKDPVTRFVVLKNLSVQSGKEGHKTGWRQGIGRLG